MAIFRSTVVKIQFIYLLLSDLIYIIKSKKCEIKKQNKEGYHKHLIYRQYKLDLFEIYT